ncbi:MAG: hypothetical protein U9R50_07290 [Campylobacterota bacterium]|nr:hypothetical protein [Campylobacterota bacterium]
MKRIVTLMVMLSLTYLSAKDSNTTVVEDKNMTATKVEKATDLLGRFNFGVGIGYENYKTPYISKVETLGDDRIVRISDS